MRFVHIVSRDGFVIAVPAQFARLLDDDSRLTGYRIERSYPYSDEAFIVAHAASKREADRTVRRLYELWSDIDDGTTPCPIYTAIPQPKQGNAHRCGLSTAATYLQFPDAFVVH